MVKAKKTGSRVRMMFSNKDSSSHTEPKGCCPYYMVLGSRLEICQKIYTTAFFGPKIIYTKSAKIVNIFDCRI